VRTFAFFGRSMEAMITSEVVRHVRNQKLDLLMYLLLWAPRPDNRLKRAFA
jgi:surfactin synthase thioesterase subunit